jgi:hypothetical protein
MLSALLVAGLAAAPPAAASGPPAWTSAALADQHGLRISAGDLQGRPAIVLLVTARRARLLKKWEQALALPEGTALLRVVDVPPRGKPADVARMLRDKAPPGVRIAVDAGRVLARGLGVDPAEPHAIVLDAGGRVVASVRGRGRPPEVQAVRRALRESLAAEDTP